MAGRISPGTVRELTELYRAEAARLHRYARTVPHVDRTAADDLVQETFQDAALAWRRSLRALGPAERRRWLSRVLHNKAIDQWRANGQRTRPLDLDARSGPPQETADRALSALALDKCWAAIARMPPVRQKVAFLRWGEEWTSAEIGELLGIKQATVRAHLKLARDELAPLIEAEAPFTGADAEE